MRWRKAQWRWELWSVEWRGVAGVFQTQPPPPPPPPPRHAKQRPQTWKQTRHPNIYRYLPCFLRPPENVTIGLYGDRGGYLQNDVARAVLSGLVVGQRENNTTKIRGKVACFLWLLGLGGCFTQAGDWPHTSNTGKMVLGQNWCVWGLGALWPAVVVTPTKTQPGESPKKIVKIGILGSTFLPNNPRHAMRTLKSTWGLQSLLSPSSLVK